MPYDERGRVWRPTRSKIVAGTGAIDNSLDSRTWYDAAGRVVKVQGEQLTKTSYDRLGRQTRQFVLARTNDSSYADALSVAGDIVLEERQTRYESSDSDRVVLSATITRHPDDFGTGETTGALDLNTNDDPLEILAADLKGRASISASWHDWLGRAVDGLRVGTNDEENFDRGGMSDPPTPSANGTGERAGVRRGGPSCARDRSEGAGDGVRVRRCRSAGEGDREL